jgi:cytochrome c oxidase subunit III
VSDSTAISNSAAAGVHHEHPSYQRHHFESVEQQADTSNFAMWLFLLTEIMFFGGLFTAYLIMRNWYYPAFVEGSHQLSIFWGTSNTAVLIASSFTMAMAVWSSEMRRKGALLLFLSLTLVFGFIFLGIKGIEWHEKWEKHHVPGIHSYSIETFINPASDPEVHSQYPDDKPLAPDMAQKTEEYFFLYFAMTGMHALHMVIGVGILIFMIFRAKAGAYTTGHVTFVENFGLYWHFVDIIWIYLFALLYLISRHS